MNKNNIENYFLAYHENQLSEKNKKIFEEILNSSVKLQKAYQNFVEIFEGLENMKNDNAKISQDFEANVMQAVNKLPPFSKEFGRMKYLKLIGKYVGISLILLLFLFNLLLMWSSNRGLGLMSILTMLVIFSLPFVKKHKIFTPLFTSVVGILCVFAFSYQMFRSFQISTFYAEDIESFRNLKKERTSTGVIASDYLGAGSLDTSRCAGCDTSSKNFGVIESEVPIDNQIDSSRISRREMPFTTKNLGDFDMPNFPTQNTESYQAVAINEYKKVLDEALSTFSIDVDTASYSNMRRFLTHNQLPPVDSVRIEEMINYFDYNLKRPENKEVPFAVTTELVKNPWNEKHQLLRIGLQGYEENKENAPANNLVFLIDTSGSMYGALPLLKQGMELLVKELRPQDRVAIVTYAGNAGVVLNSTSGKNKTEIISAIRNLTSGGSTAGGAGIRLAYQIAEENFVKDANNRIILASDGDFNVGISSLEDLTNLIERKRESGIFLSVLGFGYGNYKDDKMELLADKGNGNYSYIDSLREAKKVLVDKMQGTLLTIAKDVKIQIEFNPAYVQAYRLIGYENRLLNKEDFNDDTKDAGELGVGHSVTALYEIVPAGVEFNEVPSVDELKYQKPTKPTPVETPKMVYNNELATVKLRYKLPTESVSKKISQIVKPEVEGELSEDMRFASAIAEFGMILRNSKFKGTSSLDSAIQLAKSAKGIDDSGDRAELIRLMETAKLLKND